MSKPLRVRSTRGLDTVPAPRDSEGGSRVSTLSFVHTGAYFLY